MHWDARMWMTLNPAMLAWEGTLNARGILTAVLSNVGDTVQQAVERELKWLSRFDVLVWSYRLRMAKPDPAIYRYALEKLGTRPEESLRPHRASPRQGTPSAHKSQTLRR